MKVTWLLLAALAVTAAKASIVSTSGPVKPADDVWMQKQTKVINLLSWGKMEEPFENEYYDWDIEHQGDAFTNKEAFEYFLKEYRDGFIPRDSTHNFYSKDYRRSTAALFDLFYYAKDFDTFYKAASWARKHCNFVTFTYAFSIAVFNRPDCKGIDIPPLYEILPHYFVHSDLIHEAYDGKMYGQHSWKREYNYTGYGPYYYSHGGISKYWPHGENYEEFKLSYFREDVALNDYYARWFLHWPAWLDTIKYNIPEWFKQGEQFYYFHQQLLARYNLERYANDLSAVELLYYDRPIRTGYSPNLVDMNGTPFFNRPDYYNLKDFYPYGVWRAQKGENKIKNAIDAQIFIYPNNTLEYFSEYEATDLIGKAILGSRRYVKSYYESHFYIGLEALVLGVHTSSDRNFMYGATGIKLSALRDPAYYGFLRRLVALFQSYKKTLPYYTEKELGYPGVKIDSFEWEKLTTFFDYYSYDATYALGMGKTEPKDDYHYEIKQLRLDHKPFTYKLTVTSDKAEDAMVRIFIGPKFDSNGRKLTLDEARLAYFEFDRFPVKLTTGQNVFERSSKDTTVFDTDLTTTRTFKEYVAKYTKHIPNIHESSHCGFPQHFQLPKGKKAGMPYVFFAIITPYDQKYTHHGDERYFEAFVQCGGSQFYDYKPFGFPFDRPVPYEEEFETPNVYFKDVFVFHKEDKDFFYKTE